MLAYKMINRELGAIRSTREAANENPSLTLVAYPWLNASSRVNR